MLCFPFIFAKKYWQPFLFLLEYKPKKSPIFLLLYEHNTYFSARLFFPFYFFIFIFLLFLANVANPSSRRPQNVSHTLLFLFYFSSTTYLHNPLLPLFMMLRLSAFTFLSKTFFFQQQSRWLWLFSINLNLHYNYFTNTPSFFLSFLEKSIPCSMHL
jgi:hypothetical protein